VAAQQSARPAGPASKLRASALMATSPGLALKICTRLKESGGTRGDESGRRERRGPERAGEKDNGSVPKIVPADAACSHGKTTAQPPPSTAPDIASSSRAGSFQGRRAPMIPRRTLYMGIQAASESWSCSIDRLLCKRDCSVQPVHTSARAKANRTSQPVLPTPTLPAPCCKR